MVTYVGWIIALQNWPPIPRSPRTTYDTGERVMMDREWTRVRTPTTHGHTRSCRNLFTIRSRCRRWRAAVLCWPRMCLRFWQGAWFVNDLSIWPQLSASEIRVRVGRKWNEMSVRARGQYYNMLPREFNDARPGIIACTAITRWVDVCLCVYLNVVHTQINPARCIWKPAPRLGCLCCVNRSTRVQVRYAYARTLPFVIDQLCLLRARWCDVNRSNRNSLDVYTSASVYYDIVQTACTHTLITGTREYDV